MSTGSLEAGQLAMVLGGGGARGAYQAGFLHGLAQRHPDLQVPILAGISAGAINAAYLANHRGGFREMTEGLTRLWAGLTTEQVFRVDLPWIAFNVLRWGARLLMGRASRVVGARSLLDNSPLRLLLEQVLQPESNALPGVAANLVSGRLQAVAITTSNYSTGQSVTWVQGREITQWEQPHRKSVACRVGVEHILASSAFPVFFPAVRIGACWHGDGGIRMIAPLSPAIHLGADRILAVSTQYLPSREEAECPSVEGYPPPVQVAGLVLDTIFFDALDLDALRVERFNQLIAQLPEPARAGLRPVDVLLLRPSRDLGMLASEYEPRLPRVFRYMTRGLGTEETRSNDLLSLLMFEPEYLSLLIDLGRQDAELRADEIADFLAVRSAAS